MWCPRKKNPEAWENTPELHRIRRLHNTHGRQRGVVIRQEFLTRGTLQERLIRLVIRARIDSKRAIIFTYQLSAPSGSSSECSVLIRARSWYGPGTDCLCNLLKAQRPREGGQTI